jgi:pilus assembly protein CpaB
MNRNLRTSIVVAVAVVIAALASFGVYKAVQHIPTRQVEVAHYFVAVASKALPVGTLLTKDDVRLVAWPERHKVPGSHANVDEVVGRGVLMTIQENEPLTDSNLAKREAGAGLPPTIPPGFRAVSVKVNEVIGVAGFVTPGTKVDVVVTLSKQDNSMSRIVVTNVEVLASGTAYGAEKGKDGKPIPTTVVTLKVTPEDAERIALAGNEGKILLTLRNPLDTEPSNTPGIRLASLMGKPDPAPAVIKPVVAKPKPAAAPAPAAEPSRIYTVEAIRAAKRTEEPIR